MSTDGRAHYHGIGSTRRPHEHADGHAPHRHPRGLEWPNHVQPIVTTDPAGEIKTIDLTPTDEGYTSTARFFIRALSDDFKANRRTDARAILRSVIDIAIYLGSTEDAGKHKAALMREFETPGN